MCICGHRRRCIGNRTSCELKWGRGLTIVILTCATVIPVYLPEHGGMSPRARQPDPSCVVIVIFSLLFFFLGDATCSRSAACAFRIRATKARTPRLLQFEADALEVYRVFTEGFIP